MSQANPTEAQATAYAENYILYGDQTRAFRVAFPDSKGKSESNHTKATKLHKLVHVQSRIKELQKILKKQSTEEFTLSVSYLKKALATAIQKGLADKLVAYGDDGKVVINHGPVSISGAVSAIAEINKMDGNHAAVRLAHGGDKDNPLAITLLSDEAINLRLDALEKNEDEV